jgi:hypothetical protein
MSVLDSQAVSEILAPYMTNLLAQSAFFSALSAGKAQIEHVRHVFGQYYAWRNRFHRWIGVCIVRSAPFGDSANTPAVLGELTTCLAQELTGDHHRLALSFLAALGIDDPRRITAQPETQAYADSFLRCYSPAGGSGDEALAALAGRELVVPGRNKIIMGALRGQYGVTAGLDFFELHTELEAEHFRALWDALTRDREMDMDPLVEAARVEIWEHVTFWDDVYRGAAGAGARTAPGVA